MTSYIFSFFNNENCENSCENVDKNSKAALTELEAPFKNFVEELRAFHKDGKLKKVVIQKNKEPESSEEWKELLKQRKKILKLKEESVPKTELSLLERVEKLEKLVEILMKN